MRDQEKVAEAKTKWLRDLLENRDERAAGVAEVEHKARAVMHHRCFAQEARSDDKGAQRDLEHIASTLAACISLKMYSAKTRTSAAIAVGSFVVGVGKEGATEFLERLIPPVIEALADSEMRVRLAAVEALYNVTRVVRQGIAPYAAVMLEGILKASSDGGTEVDRALAILHPLLQVTVNECRGLSARALAGALLCGLRMSLVTPVSSSIHWVISLESSPHVGRELLREHSDILELLFLHSASGCCEVAELASQALSQMLELFVSELSQNPTSFPYPSVLCVLFAQCESAEKVRWSLAVDWLLAIAALRAREMMREHGAELIVTAIRLYPRAHRANDLTLLGQVHNILHALLFLRRYSGAIRALSRQY